MNAQSTSAQPTAARPVYTAMTAQGAAALGQLLIDAVESAERPMSVDQAVQCVRKVSADIRAVDVKIVALNLVSQGRLQFNDYWQLVPAAVPSKSVR